ncbi:restriction endonuclease subunit S [Acinetobacter sp.]|uniref:restriction endonuclease subunit S n=1 Tax=Acinetobacter sp. TaxID=472 RepID=UPI002FDA880F
MSNNQLTNSNEVKYVPKLRFAEFDNGGGWEIKPFNSLYEFKTTNTFSRDFLNYETGSVKNIHYGDIHTKFSTLFNLEKENVPFVNQSVNLERIPDENYCKEGDLVFADASEDLKDVGKHIEIINLNNEKVLSGTHTLLARKINHEIITGFAGFLFNSTSIREQIQKESQGTKVLGISGTRLANIQIYYPKSKAEQKKIAICLSSLDELIQNESSKLEAYKQHKDGLLQQLFPRDGGSVPTVRFSEFSGDWIDYELGKIVQYENGKAHEKNILDNGNYVVVNSKFISSDAAIKKYSNNAFCLAKSGDILMVLSDVPNGKAIAKCYLIQEENKYTVNQRICKLTPKKINNGFLFFTINRHPFLLNFDDGVKQTNLRKEDVLNCPIKIPKSAIEQQKIAKCLSSIADLIIHQIDYIKQLKQHKKGLMQQLFPMVEDTSA